MKLRFLSLFALCVCCALPSPPALAGDQKEELLAASVRAALHAAVSDAPPTISIRDAAERDQWLAEMSLRLQKRMPNLDARKELLITIHYESTRAGLDPQLVLGLIQVESGFRKYALSKAGARGYMQVMPFWVKAIGNQEDNLFHMRTNLRYGCTILRHYLDLEKGDLHHALGRYNGSRGKSEYPNRVHAVWQKHWAWVSPKIPEQAATKSPSSIPAVFAPVPTSKPSPAALSPVAAMPPNEPVSKPKPPSLPPPSTSKPPSARSQQIAAVTPPPALETPKIEPQRVKTPLVPAQIVPRASARRDIVIVH